MIPRIIFKIIILSFLPNNFVFSQKLNFQDPVLLSSAINSEKVELFPLLSSGDSILYFIRAKTNNNTGIVNSEIWYSKRQLDSNWEASREIIVKNQTSSIIVGSKNNMDLYIMSTINGKKSELFLLPFPLNQEEIYSKVNKSDFPQLPVFGKKLHSLYVHPSGNIIILSMELKQGYGGKDLYLIKRDSTGQWMKPLNLGPTINTTGDEITPFINYDASRIYFSSTGHNSFGDADIYYSDRIYGLWNIWSKPTNLGGTINSEFFEGYFTMSNSGEATFISNQSGNHNIYYASTTIEGYELDSTKSENNIISFSIDKGNLSQQEIGQLIGDEINPVILFEEGSANLLPHYRELIYFIANKIQNKKWLFIHLVGHTDDIGDSYSNFLLSEERAKTVGESLISFGIEPERITIEGRGEKVPTYKGVIQSRILNRRVDIIFQKK